MTSDYAFAQSMHDAAAAGDRETHRRIEAAWAVLLVAWEVLEHSRCDSAFARTTRDRIRKLTDLPLRSHLKGMLDVADGTEYCPTDWRIELARRMIAYAGFLRTIVKWDLSAEVFGLVAHTLDLPADLRLAAIQGRAETLRELGRYDDAEIAYICLRECASRSGNVTLC